MNKGKLSPAWAAKIRAKANKVLGNGSVLHLPKECALTDPCFVAITLRVKIESRLNAAVAK